MAILGCETEQEKINWILANTALNGMGYESYRATDDPAMPAYDWWDEAMMWAKSKGYFPDMEDGELLALLRKHEEWRNFEAEYGPKM